MFTSSCSSTTVFSTVGQSSRADGVTGPISPAAVSVGQSFSQSVFVPEILPASRISPKSTAQGDSLSCVHLSTGGILGLLKNSYSLVQARTSESTCGTPSREDP
ncbi:hypothetical protein SKAU_G00104140 [Synaphobranchus kaupii]|uniref:Uncharacterized protein n=1 Tax=Synaphobranchus kaupii TaxID=118154 RepID=A0A9Q1G050_SYNKA|nr:hypothetical protein SKAU_G00104140 [Synaphobranchus kaupii]